MKIKQTGKTTHIDFENEFESCMWVATQNFNFFSYRPAARCAEKALKYATTPAQKEQAQEMIKACERVVGKGKKR